MTPTTIQLKEIVFEKGFNTILQRMEALLSANTLKELTRPIVTNALIIDEEKIVDRIHQKWPGFNIKNININFKAQTIDFYIWGGPYYIPEEYSSYVIMEWSQTKTERCNYERTTKEEYAELQRMPLSDFFNRGLEVTIV